MLFLLAVTGFVAAASSSIPAINAEVELYVNGSGRVYYNDFSGTTGTVNGITGLAVRHNENNYGN